MRRPDHLTNAQSRSTRSALANSAASSWARFGSSRALVSSAASDSDVSGRWGDAASGPFLITGKSPVRTVFDSFGVGQVPQECVGEFELFVGVFDRGQGSRRGLSDEPAKKMGDLLPIHPGGLDGMA